MNRRDLPTNNCVILYYDVCFTREFMENLKLYLAVHVENTYCSLVHFDAQPEQLLYIKNIAEYINIFYMYCNADDTSDARVYTETLLYQPKNNLIDFLIDELDLDVVRPGNNLAKRSVSARFKHRSVFYIVAGSLLFSCLCAALFHLFGV